MKKLRLLIATTFILVMLTGNAFAWSERSEGRPPYLPGVAYSQGVVVWHDNNNEFHLTAASRGRHVISGVIKTDGRFHSVEERYLENGDYLKVDRNKKTIRFRFASDRGLDGIDFKVRGGESVKFSLYKDGADMPQKQIFIGKKGWHPADNTFKIER
ncbi:hypothetical protein [Sporomusa aerivorans]|uniref:hypothetical protein n=1 Tax=Sporomusa aerivorans TaxID=204936 RepID=UPI00352A8AC0